MSRRVLASLLCLAVATVAVGPDDRAGGLLGTRRAYADDPVTKSARRNFEKGEKLFALGRFDEALEEYQKAFDAKPIPAFLFNIGQCYRNLADYDQAIFAFRKYLDLEPEAPNRDAVLELIKDLEAKKAHAAARDEARRTPAAAAGGATPTPVYKKWWFWTGVAAVVGGTATAIAVTRDSGPPSSDLGNIVFGK